MSDRMGTQNPGSKKPGTNIDQTKYNAIQGAIVDALRMNGEMTFEGLQKAVEARIGGHFEGAVGRYYTSVEQDLEARGVIERVGRGSAQRIRIKPKA